MSSPFATVLSWWEAGPDNPQWHKLRREGVTASEIAAVLGISPWESPFSLYWAKVNEWDGGDNAEMSAGRRAETVIADWWMEQCDPIGNLHMDPAGLYASVDRPWQLATPDRLLYAEQDDDPWGSRPDRPLGLLECKYLVHGWDGWGEDGTDEVPVHYRAQALWQLDVMGTDDVFIAAWHGAELRSFRIRRDEKDLRYMRAAAEVFLRRIKDGDPPGIDEHQATVAALKRLHPSIEDVDIEVPTEFAEGYRRARALRARAEAALDGYEARARALLGSGRRLMCNGRLVCSRSVYDQSGSMVELDSLDADPPTVDRLNPGRAASYLTPKGAKP